MSAPSAKRLNELLKTQCQIFSQVYNPTGQRTDYYPDPQVKLQTIIRAFPELKLIDEAEEIRKADVDALKRRGKGAPKKGQGRRATKGKKR